eukprot:6183595-Pleurochrysis_carterae.AAC.3
MFAVASLHCRSGRILLFGWTILYKRGHPVASLPSGEGDNTPRLQNNVNSANHDADEDKMKKCLDVGSGLRGIENGTSPAGHAAPPADGMGTNAVWRAQERVVARQNESGHPEADGAFRL